MTAIAIAFGTSGALFIGAVTVIAWYVVGAVILLIAWLLPDQAVLDWALAASVLALGPLALFLGTRAAAAFAEGIYAPRWLVLPFYSVSFTFFALLPVLLTIASLSAPYGI